MVFEFVPWMVEEAWRGVQHEHGDFKWYLDLQIDDASGELLRSHWVAPAAGAVKLNVDGSFVERANCMGGSGIIRDERGGWLFGFASHNIGGNAFVAEVTTLRDGLLLVWDGDFRKVECEVDCAEVLLPWMIQKVEILCRC